MAVKRCEKNGRVQWRARIVVDGRQRTAYRRTKAEALDAEAELRRAAKLPARGGENPTYSDFWPRVVRYCTTAADTVWKPGTARVREACHRRVVGHLGQLRLREIDARILDMLKMSLAGQYAPETVSSTMATVRQALGLAQRWGIIETIPDVRARRPAPGKVGSDEWLTEGELQRLLAKLPSHWRSVALVAARTGLRMGELQALRWSDVDLGRRQLTVARNYDRRGHAYGTPKSGRTRDVPIPPDALATLVDAQGKPGELVFPKDSGGPFCHTSYATALRRALDAADMPRKRSGSHLLRHTFASHCVIANVNSRAIMMVAGWSSEAMLARYAHLRVEDFASQFDRLGSRTSRYDHAVTETAERPAMGRAVH